MAAAESEVPIAMRKVYRRLERWRSTRKGRARIPEAIWTAAGALAQEHGGRARIPEAIWTAAGALAQEHGVNRVSQVLHLEFNHLKRMAESGGWTAKKKNAAPTPAFVELLAPPMKAAPECAIELEGRRGKVRIELKGTAAAELASFSRALWEMIS